jgi:3-hydroxy-9,10-secoandrosta-1,3,5(10)-triene-9,17-dione monooxygenase
MFNTVQTLTSEEAMERAKSLFAPIRSRLKLSEELRRQPQETVEEIKRSGLIRTLMPKRWGGYELSWKTFSATAVEVAKADASAGWCYALLVLHSWMTAFMPEQGQADVWQGNPDATIASSLNPGPDMQIERVDGGWRLSGTFGFSSGIDHSDWALIQLLVPQPDCSRKMHYFLVPRSDMTIHDDWYVIGMKGTGSKPFVLKDAFIPDHRTMELDPWNEKGISPGGLVNQSPLYRIQLSAVMPATIASVILGSTLGAFEIWKEQVVGKGRTRGGMRVAEQSQQQIRLAQYHVKLEAAQALMQQSLDFVEKNSPLEYRDRVRMRCNYAYCTQLCTEVMEAIFMTSGAQSSRESHLLQHFWRDVHSGAQHMAFNFDWVGEIFGKLELGVPVSMEY